jgi:hypothetical protein
MVNAVKSVRRAGSLSVAQKSRVTLLIRAASALRCGQNIAESVGIVIDAVAVCSEISDIFHAVAFVALNCL